LPIYDKWAFLWIDWFRWNSKWRGDHKEACNATVTIALRTMGRNWIKIETVTMDKPEVCVVATQLKLDPDAVVGKLVRLWSWAEVNRINSDEMHVTFEFLDKLVGKKGFAAALMKAGWLKEVGGVLQFPNFGRHNGPTGKGRALTAQRVSRHRERIRDDDDQGTINEAQVELERGAPGPVPAEGGKPGNQRKNTVKELLKNDLNDEKHFDELDDEAEIVGDNTIGSFVEPVSESEGLIESHEGSDVALEVAHFVSDDYEDVTISSMEEEELQSPFEDEGSPFEEASNETASEDAGNEASGLAAAGVESPGDEGGQVASPKGKKARGTGARKVVVPDTPEQPLLF